MSRLPIVALHGFLGCGRDFAAVSAAFDEAPLETIDLPGHGESPPPTLGRGNAFFGAVDLVAALIRLRTPGPVHLLGYSMGGRIVFGLLTKHPDLVRSAVVVGAHPGLTDPADRRRRADDDRALAREIEADGLPRFVDRWYEQPLFASLRERPDFDEILLRRAQGDGASIAEALRAMTLGNQPPLWDDLSSSSIPIRLVAGSRDDKYAELNETLASSSPSISSAVVAGVGHAVHVEDPAGLATELRSHIQTTEAVDGS